MAGAVLSVGTAEESDAQCPFHRGKAAARGKRRMLVSPLHLPLHCTIRDCNDEQKGFYHSFSEGRVRPTAGAC